MLHSIATVSSSSPSILLLSSSHRFVSPFTKTPFKFPSTPFQTSRLQSQFTTPMSWLNKLGFGNKATETSIDSSSSSIPQGPDEDIPIPGQQFAQFGAGCFWGVELAFQRVPGVSKTEVGYSQGLVHNPSYNDVCSGTTQHSEVVRVQFDPKECSFENLLDVFWSRHDPTTLNRQGGDVGTQYRSGIYFYSPEQEQMAKASLEKQQKILNRKIVTEILPAKKFYRAEEYHQQYLAKGGRFGFRQSTDKGCNDPIRCYG
ncbi:peptide-methionine (S)-S-oxide reductase [Ranunculus cassubicifolius]